METVAELPEQNDAWRPEEPRSSFRTVVQNRNFMLLWLGEGISLLGDQFYLVALPLMALALSEGSGAAVGIALMFAGIPRAVFVLVGGALSDYLSPRLIMILSNAVRAIVVSVLVALTLLDTMQLWHLYLASFVFGFVDAFFYPAQSSFVPILLETDQLEIGNALMQITMRVALFIGPAIAGAVIASTGTGIALSLDVMTFLVTILALSLIRDWKRKKAKKPPLVADEADRAAESAPGIFAAIRQGLRYVWNDSLLLSIMSVVALIDFAFGGAIGVGLPVLAETRFDGATSYGLMLSGLGIGSLIGVLIAGSVQFRRRGWLFIVLTATFSIMMPLIALAQTDLLIAALMALGGFGSGVFNVVGISFLQRRADPAMMGRMMSLIMLSSVGLQPIATAISGVVVDISIPLLYFSAGVIVTVGVLLLLFNREVRALR